MFSLVLHNDHPACRGNRAKKEKIALAYTQTSTNGCCIYLNLLCLSAHTKRAQWDESNWIYFMVRINQKVDSNRAVHLIFLRWKLIIHSRHSQFSLMKIKYSSFDFTVSTPFVKINGLWSKISRRDECWKYYLSGILLLTIIIFQVLHTIYLKEQVNVYTIHAIYDGSKKNIIVFNVSNQLATMGTKHRIGTDTVNNYMCA